MSVPTLITIPASHYCLKARWALDRAGVRYTEEGHAPILHFLFVLPRTRTRTVPVLVRDDGPPLTESTEIVHFADRGLPEILRLFPEDPTLARGVLELVRRFDAELGPPVRRHVYCHLVRDRDAFLGTFEGGLSPRERAVVLRGHAVLRVMLARAFRVSREAADRTRDAVVALFAEVSGYLEDGRPFLTGERFTAADLTFAALASPLLDTGERDLDRMPAELADTIRELSAMPAGSWALRLLGLQV